MCFKAITNLQATPNQSIDKRDDTSYSRLISYFALEQSLFYNFIIDTNLFLEHLCSSYLEFTLASEDSNKLNTHFYVLQVVLWVKARLERSDWERT